MDSDRPEEKSSLDEIAILDRKLRALFPSMEDLASAHAILDVLALLLTDRWSAVWNLHRSDRSHGCFFVGWYDVPIACEKQCPDFAVQSFRPCEWIVKTVKFAARVLGNEGPVFRRGA